MRKKLEIGKNDLITEFPRLRYEWHNANNTPMKPEECFPHSRKKVWWICQKNHNWIASIDNRSKGGGCPYCSGKIRCLNINEFLTYYPELAKEWNHEKNKDLLSNQVTLYSNISVWWKCEKGHEWKATINNRRYGKGCPYCSGRKVIKGETDFEWQQEAGMVAMQ